MTRFSQNGYPACITALLGRYTIPHSNGHVVIRKGATATCLLYVATRWHDEIEHFNYVGGYACRDIAGTSIMSNHASGTAIDINPDLHPQGHNPNASFSAKMHKILNTRINGLRVGDVIRWGGDFNTRVDGMHIEINAPLAMVTALANAILNVHPSPPPPPPPPPQEIDMSVLIVSRTDEAEQYSSDSQTRRWIIDAPHRDLIVQGFGAKIMDIFTTEAGMDAVAGPLVGKDSPRKEALKAQGKAL